jgi:diguanylate cyclase (GGDEF)-like protein
LRDRDLIGRIGGDEFVVVLLDCHSADLALTVTQRIITILQRPFSLGDLLVRIGASAGVALNGDTPDAGIEVLLQRADSAMYQAKRAGKGAAVVAPAPEGPADDGVDPQALRFG